MIENLVSPSHLLLILAVALLVLGPKRLPEAGRGLGSAIRGFKESLSTAERRGAGCDPAVARARSHARRVAVEGPDPNGSVSATSRRSRRAPHADRASRRAAGTAPAQRRGA